ncbi:MAG: alpha/beta hydrolase [Treponema sp.]|nr:alpha/beta hydrolase [Treponema sp.]
MIYETISLGKKDVFLKTYLHETFPFNSERKRPFALIIPGGAYNHVGIREGEPVAVKMNSLGFHAAILNYTIKPMKFPDALTDLANAVALIRSNAEKWNIDPHKIVVIGFSAGGHLAGSLGAFWNSEFLKDYVQHAPEEIKPDALLLSYPVITSNNKYWHEESIKNVIGSISPENAEKICRSLGKENMTEVVSIEKNITKDFPPAFIWHTLQDECVPAKNTLLLADSLYEAGIDCEYHLFNRGKHALSLATEESSHSGRIDIEKECSLWPELFINWLEGVK